MNNDSLAKSLLNIKMELDRPCRFYNNKTTIEFGISSSGSLQISAAPINDGVQPGRPVKDQKRYNRTLQVFGSLNDSECRDLSRDLPLMLKGQYKNQGGYNSIRFIHIRNSNQPDDKSYIDFFPLNKTDTGEYTSFGIGITPPPSSQKPEIKHFLNDGQSALILRMIKFVGFEAPCYFSLFGALIKTINKNIVGVFNNENNNNNSGNYRSQNNYGNNNSNYGGQNNYQKKNYNNYNQQPQQQQQYQQQQVDPPPPQNPPPQSQSNSSYSASEVFNLDDVL